MIISAVKDNIKVFLSDKYSVSKGFCFWTEDYNLANIFNNLSNAKAYLNPTFKNILNQVDINSIEIQDNDDNFKVSGKLEDFFMLKSMDINIEKLIDTKTK